MDKKTQVKKVEMDLVAIGERLRRVRKTLNLTIGKISSNIGLSSSLISDFEKGKKKPSSLYLYGLMQNFKINVHYIFTGEGDIFMKKTSHLDLDPAIEEMLEVMTKLEVARYTILAQFHDFKIRYRHILKELIENKEHT